MKSCGFRHKFNYSTKPFNQAEGLKESSPGQRPGNKKSKKSA